jgi:hypothetical protein
MDKFDLIYDGIVSHYGVKPLEVIEYLEDINYHYESVLMDILLDVATGAYNPLDKLIEMLDKYTPEVKKIGDSDD